MKKLSHKSLKGLARVMPAVNECIQNSIVGGGDGTNDRPYVWNAPNEPISNFPFGNSYASVSTFSSSSNTGTLDGGWIGEVICTGTVSGGSNNNNGPIFTGGPSHGGTDPWNGGASGGGNGENGKSSGYWVGSEGGSGTGNWSNNADSSSTSSPDTPITTPLTPSELSILIADLNPELANRIKELWRKELVVKGDGKFHPNSPAYYYCTTGQIITNQLSNNSFSIGHEFTHLIQGQLGTQSKLPSHVGDPNNELQAYIVESIIESNAGGGFGNRPWQDSKHDSVWMSEHINVNDGKISVDSTLWNWLNSNESMNEAVNNFVNYYKTTPDNSPDVYKMGEQNNWNSVFDKIGISHP